MGQIFCALVLFFVIFSVDAWSARRNSEQEDTLCSQDHPLYPYIKLFNVIPEEWKSENNNFKDKKPVCFTRTITTETDDNGNEINKFSSYEITFGLPKKYENLLGPANTDDGQEFVNYPPFDETTKNENKTIKNVVYIRCSKNNEEPDTSTTVSEIFDTRRSETTSPPEITTINHDLDFVNDLDEICEEHLDVDILDALIDEDPTPEPDFGNTRRNGDVLIDYTTDKPEITTTEAEIPTKYITIQPEIEDEPSIMSRMDSASFSDITTELSNLLTQILVEISNPTETSVPTTVRQDYTVSFATLKEDESNTKTTTPEITTEQPVTEEVRKSIETVTEEVRKSIEVVTEEEVRKNEEHKAFIIQMKNIVSMNSHADCFLINSKIKYGKCSEPIIPIRILTESKLPKNVELEFEENLEMNRDFDEFPVSGKENCYLLKNLTSIECPANHDDIATILEIENLPENPYDDPYFTVEFDGKCTTVSKHIDVIECPNYRDTLPHFRTEHLPDHVRLKHKPGSVNVHVEDIIVHSYSHCLHLKAMRDVECREKPNIILKEHVFPEYIDDISTEDDIRTTDIINDEDSLPTYRMGDYSLERISDIFPKSFEMSQEFQENKDSLTTPCDSKEDQMNSDPISRTTRTLPYPTTEAPEPDRRLKNECDENSLNCLMEKINDQAKELKTRRTIKPITENEEIVTTTPVPTTISPTTEVTEITIPNSRKLSKLLKTILEESATESLTRSSDVFKPDFIAKIACAQQITKNSCFYVSKYIMQPTFDDPNDYNKIIDKNLLPVDAKIISAPNLNIFEANETIYATSGKEKFVLIKKKSVDCPEDPKESYFILDTGSCAAERRDEPSEISIVKYQKGSKVYCFDFDDDMRLHQVKCPEDLTTVPVLSRPQDLKTLCRAQLKNKGHNEQMKLLRRLNIVTDYY